MMQLKNIMKSYDVSWESLVILKGINLTIESGEFTAIMGPSWSGKSTLMNIIGILDVPTSGQYFLDGREIRGLSSDEEASIRSKKIGFVFQGYNLIPRLSALEQVMLPLMYQWVGKSERLERAEEALHRVGLSEKIHNKPNQLSGGQQQRVAIARAIVTNPSILLADEPTGALDTKTGAEVMDIFRSLSQEGRTIIVITHSHEVASETNRQIHIRDGQIIDS